jgi:putative endonuclease
VTARPVGRGRSGPRLARGVAGEDRAAAWYAAAGYQILARNWRCRDGEIDLVAAHDGCVVFCEVKTRSSAAFGFPAEAVTRTKQDRLRRLAVMWLAASDHHPREIRFDVAAVLGTELEIIEDAF